MMTIAVSNETEGPLRKRRMLSSSSRADEGNWRSDNSSNSPSSTNMSDTSSSNTEASSKSSARSACDFILDIENFIPVGCLRIERYKCQITVGVWTSCDKWHWLGHPREIITPKAGPFLQNTLQESLFNASPIAPYRNLHQAGWIRLEFKMRDAEWGQIRVYILPEDIGRRMIERNENSLRRSLRQLMIEIDVSQNTWNAEWSQDTPVVQIDSDLNEKENDVSLFYLFNNLPSPVPDPSIVHDPYARDAMDRILNGKVKGLKTKMLSYQQRSAAMMLQKEAQPSQLLDPRLRRVVDQSGLTWYCDTINGTCLRTPRMFEAARGGICAETMGLGKTLICLSLILATRELSSEIPIEYSVGMIPVRNRVGSLLDMCAATIGRTGTPWKEYIREMEEDGSDYSRCKDAIRRGLGYYYIPAPTPVRASRNPTCIPPRKIYLSTATLVVVPANLVRQWEREIEKHTTGLKVLVMRGLQTRLPLASELAEYDIILFSRQRFDRESRDGSDEDGRRPGFAGRQMSQIGTVYHSPLRDLHFKRLITDEGHTMGNARNTTKSQAVIVVDLLQLTSRWIVSGTPTQGLYGADITAVFEETDSVVTPEIRSIPASPSSSSDYTYTVNDADNERKDLEKLGNIATSYLKARPWANAKHDQDFAAWSQYVMQPRHGSKSHGNTDCLRSTLEGMIIRHRPSDVEKDIVLPALHQKIVYLDGSLQDKLSLNLFSLVITSNAVQSERKDADYLFHPRQRKALGELVANLRQASFFWCGFTQSDIETTIQLAESFLTKGEVYTSEEDRDLLQKVVECGEAALSNPIWLTASKHHEMPFFLQNDWTSDVRKAWALDTIDKDPTLIGSTQLLAMQKFVHTRLTKNQPIDGLKLEGEAARKAAILAASSHVARPKTTKAQKKLDDTPTLAGGIRIIEEISPRKKRLLTHSALGLSPNRIIELKDALVAESLTRTPSVKRRILIRKKVEQSTVLKKRQVSDAEISIMTSNSSGLSSLSAEIISTASSKLSYLMDQIVMYQKSEKIIVFYETDNVAYYLAQALEAINVEHLIYAKSLSSDRRSSYIVTFNQSAQFRVLLMDISQAAFGLDVSSASRVYFINPVFNKQVEAQAVKRAHRIGQSREVYVETLVLRGSIEEVIIERRKAMSSDEQKNCKTVLDDQTMYDWIKNVRFVPLPKGDIPSPDQMARLETPQPVFKRSIPLDGAMQDPDAGLLDFTPFPTVKRNKGKRKATASLDHSSATSTDLDGTKDNKSFFQSPIRKRYRKAVTFAIDDDDDDDMDVSEANNAPATPIERPTLSQLNSIPHPFGPASPASDEYFSCISSREGSPASKAERSRLDAHGARLLLARLRNSASPSPHPGSRRGSVSS